MPYISETVHPSLRATLMTMPGFMIAAGMLLVWTLGYFLTWRIIAHLLVIPPILLILSILPLPETPYWLIENNQVIKARKSLQFFRGKDYDETGEFDEIKEKHESKQKLNKDHSWRFIANRILSLAFLKPYACVGILYLINTWGGFSQIQIFMIEILQKSGSSIDPKIGPIATGVIRIFFAGRHNFC